MFFETLESRQLFSVSLVAGTLTVNGTNSADTFVIGKSGNSIFVQDGITQHGYSSSLINKIVVNGNGGDDNINVSSAVTKPTVIHGGEGNDVIHGGGGNNNIWGDNGNDKLYGGTGSGMNVIYGGAGDDQLWAGHGKSYLSGDDGNDTLVTIGGSHADSALGGNGTDSFWVDAETTEKTPDVSSTELALGNVHRVAGFNGGVSRDRLGQNLSDPDAYDPAHSYLPDYANFSAQPLFASTGPSEDDIHQGLVGDCFFLAVLSGTAKNDPNRIRQSVVDLGDGTFAVQFQDYGTSFIRVDADLPVYSYTTSTYYEHLGTQNSIWAAIMEKAFAARQVGGGQYSFLNGGEISSSLMMLGGSNLTAIKGGDAVSTLDNIQNELAAGETVCAATPNFDPTNGCPCIGDHAYTVDRVNYVSGYRWTTFGLQYYHVPVSIVLRNPWGYDGAGTDSNTSDGYVTVTADQYFGYFTGAVGANV
jgi:hypothetical protein